jgi:hypothetical protein
VLLIGSNTAVVTVTLGHRPSSDEAKMLLTTRHSILGMPLNQRVTDPRRELCRVIVG